MELTFFTVACMMLCFGFKTKIVLTTHQFQLLLNSACTALRLWLFLMLPPQRVGRGWARDWERTQPGHLTSEIFEDWLGIGLLVGMGNDCLFNLFVFFFPSLVKLSLSWPKSFLAFDLQAVSPILVENKSMSDRVGGQLLARVKPPHW